MPLGAAKVALLGAAGSGEDALGYMLFWGDPDGTEGGQETYPYSLELLNDGTTVRVGGRWNLNPGGNATQRIAHSNLDMSGGAGVAPTTSTVQTAWSFSITSSTQEGIYQEQSGQGLAISAADNFYSTGNVYGAGSANYWYNLGVGCCVERQSLRKQRFIASGYLVQRVEQYPRCFSGLYRKCRYRCEKPARSLVDERFGWFDNIPAKTLHGQRHRRYG